MLDVVSFTAFLSSLYAITWMARTESRVDDLDVIDNLLLDAGTHHCASSRVNEPGRAAQCRMMQPW